MAAFDYDAKADLFVRGAFPRRKPLEYRLFPLAGEAIRYVMEELAPERLGGICMEVEGERFGQDGIRQLYESSAYPLVRQPRTRKSCRRKPQRVGSA
jgi:hypothetical protein